jgi:hypothetical protein
MEPRVGLLLTDRAHRHDSNLALGLVHKRFHLYMKPSIPSKVSGLLTRQISWCLCAIRVLPFSATLAEELDGFLAESVFCACVPSGNKAETAIVKSNTGSFVFFLLGKKVGACLGSKRAGQRPRLESILMLLAAPRQTQDLNEAYRRSALPVTEQQCQSRGSAASGRSIVLTVS